ncbi:hypothetical protein HU733_25245 [Pseudomonas paralactis]|uniref:hypothetical protein n=1 Tax=Pseudomonas paralactis TaxID=1615673 RepID=UPI0016462EFC|nr:hypothetical protein [Pseudomonas paralactis]MBC3258811.1 hypothetical protein [Pseudomonas paralactis]
MYINEEIARIRKLLATGKVNNEIDTLLPKAPTIDLIVNGELHVDRVPDTGLEVGVDYDTMQVGQNIDVYLFGNRPGPGDHNVCFTVREVKPHTVLFPKEYVEQLYKDELGLCVYFIDGAQTSSWTTFTVK